MIKRIVISGTHLTPAQELISQLKNDKNTNWQISYIGRNFNSHEKKIPSIESQVIPTLGIPFYGINCGKFDRKYLPNTIFGLGQTIKALIDAFIILKKIKPDIVISFGGYVSVPVIISSYFLKIKSITHEQTPTLSLSTKINNFFVNKTALSFTPSYKNPKFVTTGNLLRKEIFLNKSNLYSKLIKNKKPIIFLTAGNQGSIFLNQTLIKILPKLSNFNIIHQTGPQNPSSNRKLTQKYKNYFPIAYVTLNDIGWVLHHTKIIISRAGANTCQEIATLYKKAIVIPLIKSQQDEQLLNAKLLKKQIPETIIITQNKLTPNTLLRAILKLNKIPYLKSRHTPTPNLKLLKLIYEII